MTTSGSAVPHIAAMNHPAAQAHLALVQHGGLAWRDSPLGLLEMQLALRSVGCSQGAGGIGLAVAGLGTQRGGGLLGRDSRRSAGDPAAVLRAEFGGQQPGVVVALHHPQRVGL